MITKNQASRLRALKCVDDVEDAFLDDGRFFVHLKTGYDWKLDPRQVTVTKSFDNFTKARRALRNVEKVT